MLHFKVKCVFIVQCRDWILMSKRLGENGANVLWSFCKQNHDISTTCSHYVLGTILHSLSTFSPRCICVEVMFLLVRFKSCLITKPRRLAGRQVIKICNLILNSHRQALVGHPSTLWKNRRINIGMWCLRHPTSAGTGTIRGDFSFDFPLNCPSVVPGDL